ncbi:cupin domain-containing protein [Crossiella cryophila]|uniref:Quercetin dioxygenase-like cupin family protein n=1 Tax=Crossiella cryophila TaxID=43355 RepID=A0A7W7FWN5_9PSEU|nr:cupin domain-containing protein [Crossiella cryophila]MBB4678114.1 quercetin dioxygenase-like cupin family protein [Crossiella cryophila]
MTSQVEKETPRALYVPPGEGPSVWAFSGDRYTVKAGIADTGGALGLLEAVIPPQSGPPLHLHRNEDEAFYLIEGQLEVVANGRPIIIEPGSFIYIPRGSPHRFKNVGETHAKLLIFFVPSGFEEFFLEVGIPVIDGEEAPPEEQHADDVARSMRIAADKYGIEAV